MGIEHSDLSSGEIYLFDATAGVIVWLLAGKQSSAAGLDPRKSPVVTNITMAVGTDGRPIGSTANLRHHSDLAIAHSRQGAAGNLDDEYATVDHCDRPFRKSEPFGHQRDVAHQSLPLVLF